VTALDTSDVIELKDHRIGFTAIYARMADKVLPHVESVL
jgi:hypothetical protein